MLTQRSGSVSGGRLKRMRTLSYFLDAWNILDWFNLIMMIITVCHRDMFEELLLVVGADLEKINSSHSHQPSAS